jgi:single-stranded DNA-binding protein
MASNEINQIVISGNVVYIKDPVFTDKGVQKGTIIVNTDPFAKVGNAIPCTVWGEVAEFVSENVEKGMPVLVGGKLIASQYEKEGKKTYYTFIQANVVKILGPAEEEVEEEEEEAPRPKKAPPKPVTKSAVKSTKTWSKPKAAAATKRRPPVEELDEDLDDNLEEEDDPIE